MGRGNQEGSSVFNKGLDERSMWKGLLVLESIKANLMLEKVRYVDIVVWIITHTKHEVNGIVVADSTISNLRIQCAKNKLE